MVTQAHDGMVEFRFFRPNALQVILTGEFNGWHKTNFPMTKGADGWWRYQLKLAPGCYQFRYLGDGQWYTDYAAFGIEPGPLGVNSVVKVDPPQEQDTPSAPPPAIRLPHISETDDDRLDPSGPADERQPRRRESSLAAPAAV